MILDEIVYTGDVYFKNMKIIIHLILSAIDSNSTMEGLNISHYKIINVGLEMSQKWLKFFLIV